MGGGVLLNYHSYFSSKDSLSRFLEIRVCFERKRILLPKIFVRHTYRIDTTTTICKHWIQREKLMKNRNWVTFLLISPFNGIEHQLYSSFFLVFHHFISHLRSLNKMEQYKVYGAGGNKAVEGLQNMRKNFCNMLSTGKGSFGINIWNKVLFHYPPLYDYFPHKIWLRWWRRVRQQTVRKLYQNHLHNS